MKVLRIIKPLSLAYLLNNRPIKALMEKKKEITQEKLEKKEEDKTTQNGNLVDLLV